MTGVILQPSYIPWRGFFDQIRRADIFVFYDDVQYDRRGWRNRNRVKTPQGSHWLTIPVCAGGVQDQSIPINQIKIDASRDWTSKHWATLVHCYSKAPFFRQYAPILEQQYASSPLLLADFTIEFTITLARELGINKTQFLRSSELPATGSKTERLISLLLGIGTNHYLSGPSARDYIDERLFHEAGISLEYMTYDYPEYPQLYPPFDPFVSILDLLFMCGPKSGEYIWAEKGAPLHA